MPKTEWELRRRRDNNLVATFHGCNSNFPWMICTFDPTADYEEYRSLFEEQEELIKAIDQKKSDPSEWPDRLDAIYHELNRELMLMRVRDSMLVSEFLLYVIGEEAHFRFLLDEWKK